MERHSTLKSGVAMTTVFVIDHPNMPFGSEASSPSIVASGAEVCVGGDTMVTSGVDVPVLRGK